MVTTVFDKTQVWPRKSILSVKSYPDLAVNHLKLIRDNFKIFLGDENLAQKLGGFLNGDDSTCRLITTAYAKWFLWFLTNDFA